MRKELERHLVAALLAAGPSDADATLPPWWALLEENIRSPRWAAGITAARLRRTEQGGV